MFFGERIFEMALFMNLFWVVPLALVGLAVPYVTARMRERNGPPDPHIGIKTAHYFFFTMGIFLMLSGLTLICVELMEIDSRPRGGFGGFRPSFLESPAVRIGFAMNVVGGLFALMHRLMLLATNDGAMPQVRRAFGGLRFVVSGLIVLITLTIVLSVLFQRGSEFNAIKPFLGVLIVWIPSWFLHMAFLLVSTPRANPLRPQPDPERYYDD